jgi:hypothetical protein
MGPYRVNGTVLRQRRPARRHLYRPELAGTSRRQHHDDLNASPESGRNASVPSGGRVRIARVLLGVFGRSARCYPERHGRGNTGGHR